MFILDNITILCYNYHVNQFHKEGEQLENYTKYKLKSGEELASLLADKDNLLVIACNKCFK